MARSMKSPDTGQSPGKGHNLGSLTTEEQEALYITHLQSCREQDAFLEKAMETVRATRKVRNVVRNLAKGDGFPLAVIDEVLKAEGRSRGDLQAEADMRRNMWSWAGLPVGGQADLFATTPVEVKDAMDWEASGYAAGLRGANAVPPEGCPPRFHQDWLKGRDAGQERLAWGLSERGKIVDRRSDIGTAAPVQLDPVDEKTGDVIPDEETIKKGVRKLKASGFTDKPLPGAKEVLKQARADAAADQADGTFQPAAA